MRPSRKLANNNVILPESLNAFESQPAGLTPRYNAKVKRRLFNTLAGTSLILCVASALLWPCGYLRDIEFHTANWRIDTTPGGMQWIHDVLSPPIPNDNSGSGWSVYPPEDPSAAQIHLGFAFFSQNTTTGPEWVAREQLTVLLIPMYAILIATAVLPAYWLVKFRRVKRAHRRFENHFCIRCGYDLRATPDRCPECGHVPEKVKSIL